MRLIDAAALSKDGWVLERHGVSNTHLQSKSLADVPTVDAVPVVRCKECKHWDDSHGIGWCDCHSKILPTGDWTMFNADDYCSYAERRTE